MATHLRFVERSSRKLARNTFYGMARWQAAMEQKQGFLGRVVDIGAELFAMSATCVRAEAQRVADPARGQQAYELAEAFCQQATLRVEALFNALWTNTDSTDGALARNVLKGRYTWLEDGIVDQSEGTGPWIAHWEAGASTEARFGSALSAVLPTILTETTQASYVAEAGEFTRDTNYIATRITADGRDGYPVEPGRYRLIVARACPWANRAIIVRRLLGLESVISIGFCGPTHDKRSWTFDLDPGGVDPVLKIPRLQEAYFKRFPDYPKGITVPAIVDVPTARW